MFRRYIFTIMLTMLAALSVKAADIAQRNSGLWLDNVPAVADSTTFRMYFTLKKDAGAEIVASLKWDDTKYASVKVNGVSLDNAANNWAIADWHAVNRQNNTVLTLLDTNGAQQDWSVVFTNLPLVLIEQTQANLFEVWKKDNDQKVPTVVTVIDANARTFETLTSVNENGEEIKTDTEGCICFTALAGVRVRGATSAGKDKKPFAVELRDENGEELNMHLLGYRNDGDWILDAMFNDRLRMRNRLIMDVWNDLQDLPYDKDNEYQKNGTDGEYVEVFMKGRYWGVYGFSDKIDRKKLNLKKTQDEGLPTEKTRGLLWKSLFRCTATTFSKYTESPLPGKLTWEETDKDITWEQKYPDDRAEQGNFLPIAQMIDSVGQDATDEACLQNIEKLFYIDNLVDYHIFTQALQLMDNLQKNMYLSVRNVQKDSQLLITPWDLDASLGRNAGGDALDNDSKWMAFGEQLGGINYLFWRLANMSGKTFYKTKFYDRWAELRKGALSIENLEKRMTEYVNLLMESGAYYREYELWNRKMNPGEDGLYEEIAFIKDFLTRNYSRFDEIMKRWGYEEGETPDNPNNPDNPVSNDETPMKISDTTALPYGKGYAVKVITLEGDTVYCMLSDKPEIQIADGKMQLTAEGNKSYVWEIDNVDFFAFQYIDNPDLSGIDVFVVDSKGNKHARFFTIDGKEVKPEQLGKGVYLMKIGGKSLKLIRWVL